MGQARRCGRNDGAVYLRELAVVPTFLAGDAANFSRDGAGVLWLPGAYIQLSLRGDAGYTQTAPPGWALERAVGVDSVQTGTSTLVLIPALADVWRFGRWDDSWDVRLSLDEDRFAHTPYSADYSAGTWSVTGTVTRTPGQIGPTGTAIATRLQCPAGTNFLSTYTGGLLNGTQQIGSQWVRPHSAPADTGVLTTGGTPLFGIGYILAADARWRRVFSQGTPAGGTFYVYPVFSSPSTPILGSAAHDWDCYGTCIETGSYPTEYMPTTGASFMRAGTLLRALSGTWDRGIVAGRIGIEIPGIRFKAAPAEYTLSPPYFWHTHSGFSCWFEPTTRVMTMRATLASATNTVTLPAWARYDLMDLFIAYGGGQPTIVRCRLNGGAVVNLPVTGSPIGDVVANNRDLYFLNSNAGGQVSCWAPEVVRFWRNGVPPWAA